MFRYFFIPFILFLLATGCNKSNSGNPVTPGKYSFTLPDSNGNISAKPGDTIEIKILNSAYDGGYSWNISSNFDSTIAKFVSYKTEYTGGPNIDGAPTYEIWHYYAIKEGIAVLILKLYRVFEPAKIIGDKSYNLTVKR